MAYEQATGVEILVIEGDQEIVQQLTSALVSGGHSLRVLVPDRPLVADSSWIGPAVVLVGLDNERSQRLAYALKVQATYPKAMIIGYTANYVAETLGDAMNWGVRRVLRYPFELHAFNQAAADMRQELRAAASPVAPTPSGAASQGGTSARRTIAVFSPKGGVGCSTLAVNLAVALQVTGSRTVLMDGNIGFGSVDVFLNLQPTRSILQLVGDPNLITSETVAEALVSHSSGLQVLLAPPRPEEADAIRGDHMQRVVAALRDVFAFTIVDTWPSFDERVLAVLEVSDVILVPIGPDLPAIKNLKQFLRVAQLLNYDMDKIVVVLMRANSVPPGYLKDIEEFLKQPLRWRVVSDGKRATAAANSGTPFVLSDRAAPISQNVLDLARYLAGSAANPAETAKPKRGAQAGGRFWRR